MALGALPLPLVLLAAAAIVAPPLAGAAFAPAARLAAPREGATPPPYCGPARGQTAAAWRQEMVDFRTKLRAPSIAGGTPGSFCNASDLYGRNHWARHTFVCPQSGLYDRYLYDSAAHRWTVGRFLADLEARYGGVDCVLLWQSYTNMGIDARNQIDLLRVAPGGVAGLKDLVAQFHAANVSVLFPWNQWGANYSNSAREEPDNNFLALLSEVGADGFNADSAGRGAVPGVGPTHGFDGTSFVKAGLSMGPVFNGHDLLDQPEHASGCPSGLIMGGWAGEAGGPGNKNGVMCVECAKWIEPRHLSQFVERNQVLRQPALKWAFFNGNGYNTWESIWGGWNGISDRDAETIRRIFTGKPPII